MHRICQIFFAKLSRNMGVVLIPPKRDAMNHELKGLGLVTNPFVINGKGYCQASYKIIFKRSYMELSLLNI